MQNKNTYLSVKELPLTERPYEKCEEFGVSSLSDAELLAVIIKSGTHGERSVDLARRLLVSLDKDGRLCGLNSCSLEDLRKINGVGRVKAIQLVCAAELGRRLVADNRRNSLDLFNAESVAAYYTPLLSHLQKETVMLLHADGKGRIFAEETISVGTVNSALISPREVFLSALTHKSVNIFLIHNHPSGDPSPSIQDIQVTERIAASGRLLGIDLLDHLVLGNENYYSFSEMGQLARIKQNIC